MSLKGNTPASPPSRHLPALDGLRGLAILAVMIHHFGGAGGDPELTGINFIFSRLVGAGWAGVDLFFVLSGFLITGILADTRDTPHALRNFYARRVLRIFPLYYGLLLALFVILPAIARTPLPGVEKAAPHQSWLWLYLSNFVSVFGSGEPYRAGLVQLGHFWSLAVEEQFYLLWPFFVLALRRKTLIKLCAAAIVASLALRIALATNAFPKIYFFTPCRLDGLMFGALLALALRSRVSLQSLLPYAKRAIVACGTLLTAILILRGFDVDDPVITTAGFTLLALFFTATTILALAAPADTFLGRATRNRTLTFFGKYSYGLYVFHFALHPTFRQFFGVPVLIDNLFHHYWPARFAFIGLSIAASVAAAWLSWHLYEKQFLKFKRIFESRPSIPAEGSPHVFITPLPKAA